MATLLPPNDLNALRVISRTLTVLLACKRFDQVDPGCSIADYEVADALEQDRRTVLRQLHSLSASGLLARHGYKWVLTRAGRNTPIGWLVPPSPAEGSQETPQPASHDTHCVQKVVHGEPGSCPHADETLEDEPEPGAIACEGTDNDAHCVPQLIEEEEESQFKINPSSSSSIEDAKNVIFTKRILQETNLLFGSAVTVNDEILERSPKYALCWVAKAYADRACRDNPKGLLNPQGLIYTRLMGGVRPPVYLLKDPTQGLPNKYLVAIGMAEPEPEPAPQGDDWKCRMCGRIPCICEEEQEQEGSSPPLREAPEVLRGDRKKVDLGPWSRFSRYAVEREAGTSTGSAQGNAEDTEDHGEVGA